MTTSLSYTTTFSITNARYVTSKIKTDLRLLQRFYRKPSDEDVDDYDEEAAQLLAKGYLDTVTYGFRRNGLWIPPTLRYVARNDGTLASDDRAGRVPAGLNVSGASFYSYLTYSSKWDRLTAPEQQAVKDSLPVKRSGAPEPGSSGGYWAGDRTYSSNGSGVGRSTLRPL